MAKEIIGIVEGMPSEILEPKDDYRDDALRIKACVHYLIGYLEEEEEAYKEIYHYLPPKVEKKKQK